MEKICICNVYFQGTFKPGKQGSDMLLFHAAICTLKANLQCSASDIGLVPSQRTFSENLYK